MSDELYDLVIAKLPDWIEPAQRQVMTLDVLDALQPVLDARRGIGGNQPPEPLEAEQTEEQRLLRIDPEHLVIVEPGKLPALFALHYPVLAERGAELLERCQQWQKDHKTPRGGLTDIKDDAENAALADFIVMLDDFAAEVREAHKKVKGDVYHAGQQIDGWFTRGLADPVMDIRGVTRTVSGRKYPPEPGTMQFAQTQYLAAKAGRERKVREDAAREAAAEAKRKADAARQAAEEEAARATQLEQVGMAPEEAREIAAIETDQFAAEADRAQQTSALVGSFATERLTAMVRSHTATGTTVGLRETWDFDETQVDMKALCRGVVEGTVPVTFVTVVSQTVRQAIRARINPLRECPGLVISATASAARRSAR